MSLVSELSALGYDVDSDDEANELPEKLKDAVFAACIREGQALLDMFDQHDVPQSSWTNTKDLEAHGWLRINYQTSNLIAPSIVKQALEKLDTSSDDGNMVEWRRED